MDMSIVVDNVVRYIIFSVCMAALSLIDFFYKIILELVTLDLGGFSFIWKWWQGLLGLLFLFIVARLTFLYFKSMYDEEAFEKVHPQEILVRVGIIGMILIVFPVFVEGLSKMTSQLTKNLSSIIGLENSIQPSALFFLEGTKISNLQSAKDISINLRVAGEYQYYPETTDLILLLLFSIIGCLIFLYIGIQIAQRIQGMLMKIGISPYAISSIVVEGDSTFDTWWKLMVADFLTTFFQILLIYLVFTSLGYVQNLSKIAKLLFFLGGLFSIMNAPQGIAQLLGGDIGAASAMQGVQSMQMLSTGVNAAGHVAGVASSIGSGTGAAGAYGLGRLFGGKSLADSVLSGGRDTFSGGSGIGSENGGGSTGGSNAGFANVRESGVGYNPGGSAENTSDVGTFDSGASSLTKSGSLANRAGEALNKKGTVGRLANMGMRKVYQSSANRLFKPQKSHNGTIKHTSATQVRKVRNAIREAKKGGE